MLFRCNTGGGKIIRGYTGSEWDHVAMVLKFGSDEDEVFLIEATGKRGVHLKKFSVIIPHIGKFYEKVAWRKLNFKRKNANLDKLDTFVEEAVGCKYKFRGRDLARSRTKKFDKEGERKFIDSDRTFFCSELVAKAFKVCEITEDNDEDGSNNYMPGHFTVKNKEKIKFINDITADDEKTIVFDSMPKCLENKYGSYGNEYL